MIPISESPLVDIVSITSALVRLPDASTATKYGDKPRILGYRIMAFRDSQVDDSPVLSVVCGLDTISFLAENLESGYIFT